MLRSSLSRSLRVSSGRRLGWLVGWALASAHYLYPITFSFSSSTIQLSTCVSPYYLGRELLLERGTDVRTHRVGTAWADLFESLVPHWTTRVSNLLWRKAFVCSSN